MAVIACRHVLGTRPSLYTAGLHDGLHHQKHKIGPRLITSRRRFVAFLRLLSVLLSERDGGGCVKEWGEFLMSLALVVSSSLHVDLASVQVYSGIWY